MWFFFLVSLFFFFLAKSGLIGIFLPFAEFKVTHLRPLVDFNDCWQVVWMLSGFLIRELLGIGPRRHLLALVQSEETPSHCLRGRVELGHH